MVDLPDERSSRRYFGYPSKVPFYLEDAWSFCVPPTQEEAADFVEFLKDKPGSRLEALCRIEADDDVVARGFIVTVPKL